MELKKTRVKIAVVISHNGDYIARGGFLVSEADDCMVAALEEIPNPVVCYWIDAELEIPVLTAQTFTATPTDPTGEQ